MRDFLASTWSQGPECGQEASRWLLVVRGLAQTTDCCAFVSCCLDWVAYAEQVDGMGGTLFGIVFHLQLESLTDGLWPGFNIPHVRSEPG
jgi:hypothetical protein